MKSKQTKIVSILFILFTLTACNINSSQNQFELAEQLFKDKKYEGAAHEFQKIFEKDQGSTLGLESLYRVATIRHLYTKEPLIALKAYERLLEKTKNKEFSFRVRKIVAAMYFEKFENYRLAIRNYKILLKDFSSKVEKDFFLYRIARSFFLLSMFDNSIKVFSRLAKLYPESKYAKKSKLAIANAMSSNGNCKYAVKQYKKLLKNEKQSEEQRSFISFGLASCYEELDNLDKAYDLFAGIKNTYPVPSVVMLKMKKIKRRKIFRQR